MKKNIHKILLLLSLIIILILLPFFIEQMVVCETIFPFNMPIFFSKESWFGFIASYLGAIGSVALGFLALFQNKKYKEQSDSTEEKIVALQSEIKNLTEKNVALIELNSKLERAKYYPYLSNIHSLYWGIKEGVEDYFDLKNDSFQFSYDNIQPSERPSPLAERLKKYYTFVYTLKNDGERAIRNFTCVSIVQNNQLREEGFLIMDNCDISPGAILRCVYVTSSDFVERCKNGDIRTLSFKYKMENVIGEHFEMTMDLYFSPTSEDGPPDYVMEISPIRKV